MRDVKNQSLTLGLPSGRNGEAGRSPSATILYPLGRYLTKSEVRSTLSYMKTSTLTIRLDKGLEKLLGRASKESGKSKSEVAREALHRQLRIVQFESLRKKTMPFAEARGYLTDEEVFRDIS